MCSFDGCDEPSKARSLCVTHYGQWRRGIELRPFRPRGKGAPRECLVADCDRPMKAGGLCGTHYEQHRLGKDVGPIRTLGSTGRGWTDKKNRYRYIYVGTDHPNANSQGVIAEHRYVMSMTLGRPLRDGENVHHINGVRHDNRPENLELWLTSQPAGQRLDEVLLWVVQLTEQYADEIKALKEAP